MTAVVPRSDHRRSLATLAVWSIGFVAVLAVAAWQFGWISTEDGAADLPPTDGQAELAGGSSVPFAAGADVPGAADPWNGSPGFTPAADPAVFEQQSEPDIVPNPSNEITTRDDERRGRLWNHVREMPTTAEDTWPPAQAAPRYSTAAEPAGWLVDDARAAGQRRPAGGQHPLEDRGRVGRTVYGHPLADASRPAPLAAGSDPRDRDTTVSSRAGTLYDSPSGVQLAGVEEISTEGSTIATPAGNLPGDLDPSHPAAGELAQIDELIARSDIKEAHRRLSTLYWKQPDWRPVLQKRVDQTAESIYFSNLRHYMEPHVVEPGDQLLRIAAKYKVSWQYLERLNGVQANRIRPGQRLKVIKGPFAAHIDLSDFELTVHAHGWYVRSYRVGIGREGSTPVGKFTVQEKLVNPTYYRPAAEGGGIVAADDPSNPLGEYWIGLGDSYGIHGTIDPQSIGRGESRGCIRLLNEDVAEVYDFLVPGSEVVIQP